MLIMKPAKALHCRSASHAFPCSCCTLCVRQRCRRTSRSADAVYFAGPVCYGNSAGCGPFWHSTTVSCFARPCFDALSPPLPRSAHQDVRSVQPVFRASSALYFKFCMLFLDATCLSLAHSCIRFVAAACLLLQPLALLPLLHVTPRCQVDEGYSVDACCHCKTLVDFKVFAVMQ
jgi:hypothetical protein